MLFEIVSFTYAYFDRDHPTMTEESLQALPINDLFDLMVKSMNELLAMNKIPHDKLSIKAKQKEVELLQKVIVAKRAEFPPGK